MATIGEFVRDVESLATRLGKAAPHSPLNSADINDLRRLATALSTLVLPNTKVAKCRLQLSSEFSRHLEPANGLRRSEPSDIAAFVRGNLLPFSSALAHVSDVGTGPTLNERGEFTNAAFGNWNVRELIGRGGYGEVYATEHSFTGLRACIKVVGLNPKRTEEEQEQRFKREVRVPADVGHPTLVPIYDCGIQKTERVFYIVMERIKGSHFDTWATKKSDAQILQAFTSLLNGLQKCHDAGLVHRDLKPSNVLVTDNDHVFILDFGLTLMAGMDSVTQSGDVLGTLRFISPEQTRDSRTATPQSDIWSLGVMLYELLTGLRLFPQEYGPAVIAAVLAGDFVAPRHRLPKETASIVEKCTSMEPSARYEDVAALQKDIQALAKPAPRIEKPTQGMSQGATKAIPRNSLIGEACDFCGTVGQWFGTRCGKCGRYQSVD
ncbi:MAG: serine/threonine protein kinase [Deltaproteobacteria bacterium]|nr:serine/threonine protein kinase [Deltaproteobacteria bacterium]